jgi:hypothetical protein
MNSKLTSTDIKELNIVTSSCDPMNLQDLKGKIMTTNWGISMGLRNIDYYVCSVTEPSLLKEINKLSRSVDTWMVTNNVKNRITTNSIKWVNLFKFMNQLGALGSIHMKEKKLRNGLNLPTSGAQMIYIASFMNIKVLNIQGVNLYTIKDVNGNYKKIGDTAKENPYSMSSKPHDIRTDVTFISDSFKRLINRGSNIIVDSDILKDIISMCRDQLSNSTIADNIRKRTALNHWRKK